MFCRLRYFSDLELRINLVAALASSREAKGASKAKSLDLLSLLVFPFSVLKSPLLKLDLLKASGEEDYFINPFFLALLVTVVATLEVFLRAELRSPFLF